LEPGSWDLFDLVTLAQCLLKNSKSERVDSEKKQMKFDDLYLADEMKGFLRSFVRSQHEARYQADVRQKMMLKKKTMAHDLVRAMLQAPSVVEFNDLLKNGLRVGCAHHSIGNTSSAGWGELKAGLMDFCQEVPDRPQKVRSFLLGKTEVPTGSEQDNKNGNMTVLYNGGNTLFHELGKFRALFDKSVWIKVMGDHLVSTAIYSYRPHMSNRHGHSNARPSYWAYGFATLEQFRCAVYKEQYALYVSDHAGCCGIGMG
jgi:hypothetical protein